MAAIAYYILERAIIAKEGRDSLVAQAVGRDWKGKLSAVLYFVAIPLAFVSPWIASGLVCVWRAPLVDSRPSDRAEAGETRRGKTST